MAGNEAILALDVGAWSLKIGEFIMTPEGVSMRKFAVKEFDEGLTDENREDLFRKALDQILEETAFDAKRAYISLSCQSAFTKFAKLPPVENDEARVKQIVEFEARQNVPFDMDEVIWDYQLIGSGEESLDVMFVVVKDHIIESITDVLAEYKINTEVVDIASTATYNSARANKIGSNGCSMVLSIGSRTSNLIFVDSEKMFIKNIPIAGYSVTQQIAKEFGIGMEEAEELKQRHGFVALGGAYEEPDSEVAATISKIVRNVMTRLHGEVNRSMNIYRSQHKGNKPNKLYLTGGSSVMDYTENFFKEKLRIDVEYLNPFQVIKLENEVNRQTLAESAHLFGEVVGVALRAFSQMPAEISLVPELVKDQLAFSAKKPYLIGSAIVAMLIPATFWLGIVKEKKVTDLSLRTSKEEVSKKVALKKKVEAVHKKLSTQQKEIGKYYNFINQQNTWYRMFDLIESNKPEGLVITGIKSIEGDVKFADGLVEKDTEKVTKVSTGGLFTRKDKQALLAKKHTKAKAQDIGGVSVTGYVLFDKVGGVDVDLLSSYINTLKDNSDLFLDIQPALWQDSKSFKNLYAFEFKAKFVTPVRR